MDKKQILEALKDTINKITNPYETSKENSEDDGGTTIQVDNEDDIVDLGSQEVEFPKHLIQAPYPPEGTHAEWNEFIPGYLPLIKKKDEEETKAPSSIADVYARDPRFAPQEPNAGLKLGRTITIPPPPLPEQPKNTSVKAKKMADDIISGIKATDAEMGGNRIANNIISGIKATDAEMGGNRIANNIISGIKTSSSTVDVDARDPRFAPQEPNAGLKLGRNITIPPPPLPKQPMDRAVKQFRNREEEQNVVKDFNQQTKSTLSAEDQKRKAEFDQYQKDYEQYQKDYDQWAKDNPEALKQRLRQQRREFHGKDPAYVTTTGDEIYNPEIAAKVKAQEQQIAQMNANTAAMNAESEKIQKEIDRLASGQPSEAYERKRLGIPDDGSRRPDTRQTSQKLPMGGGRMAEENSSYYYRRLANLFEETREPSGPQVNQAAYGFNARGGRNARKALASLQSGMWRGDSTAKGSTRNPNKERNVGKRELSGEDIKQAVATLYTAAMEHPEFKRMFETGEFGKAHIMSPSSAAHRALLAKYPQGHEVHQASAKISEYGNK